MLKEAHSQGITLNRRLMPDAGYNTAMRRKLMISLAHRSPVVETSTVRISVLLGFAEADADVVSESMRAIGGTTILAPMIDLRSQSVRGMSMKEGL